MRSATDLAPSLFQSTLPRGERRGVPLTLRTDRRVSIHAPAGGATRGHPGGPGRRAVSIHAPAGGATRYRYGFWRVGRVSIHAPAGGATVGSPNAALTPSKFQSTLPRGERHQATQNLVDARLFQSTLPRGERPDCYATGAGKVRVSIHAPAGGATLPPDAAASQSDGFNPRSRGGSDRRSSYTMSKNTESVWSREPPRTPCCFGTRRDLRRLLS